MDRITMSLEEDLAKDFDALITKRGYSNRSEAIRDLLRREIEANRLKVEPAGDCVASLSYVYNHHMRDLAKRLNDAQHAHHDLVIVTMHIHLDHEHCLETVILRGPIASVRALSDGIRTERGVSHGQLHVITVDTGDKHTRRSAHHHHQGHMHLIPKT